MVDIDLYDIHILTPQEIDLAQVSRVKQIESQNASLKYGLIVCGILIGGFLLYLHEDNKKKLEK